MKNHKHWAIYGSGLSMESHLVKNLLGGKAEYPFDELSGKTGALFSNLTLNKFIKEEVMHDDFTLSRDNHRSIQTFSSGEQKKALLNYLLSCKPGFLILEDPFDMLDSESQHHLVEKLNELSATISIIQIFKRMDHILPFMDVVLQYHENQLIYSGTIAGFHSRVIDANPFSLSGEIPPALVEFEPYGNPLIAFNNISVSYGERCVLNNICWEINPGDFWQLMGPNGSGKTTLLTMLTSDNPQAYGQDLYLFGRKKGSGESIWDIKRKIGYVTPAMTVLFKGWHTVENMIISGLHDSIGLYQKPSFLEKELAQKWLELIGLMDQKKTLFVHLTEEQQCLVLIARSMIKHPPLLILDEPTHGLDDFNVNLLIALINKIANESKTTVIYVSHKKEKGLIPKSVFELILGELGSKGKVRQPE